MKTFCVKLAGVPLEITTAKDSLQDYFADYFTDEEPLARLTSLADDRNAILDIHRVVSDALIDFDALLFHSSAIMYHGEAVLFAAPSGTGKSTHAAYWKELFGDEVTYVNDDKPFLRPLGIDGDSRPYVCGSPWRGKHRLGANISAPIRALCIISRADKPHISEVPALSVLPEIMYQVYVPDGPERIGRALELLNALLSGIKVYKLECNLDSSCAKLAQDAIFGE